MLHTAQFIYGVWRFLDAPVHGDKNRVRRLIDQSLELGINIFDHADIYGGYTCEKLFGEAAQGIPRTRYRIITKCGIKLVHPSRPHHQLKTYDTTATHIQASVDQSLKNLKTDFIDLLLIHRPDPLMDATEVAEQFKNLIKVGKVGAFGVSNFKPFQFDLLQKKLPFPLITNQIELSLLHHDPLTDGTLDHAQEFNYRPTIWSPLGGGRLFTDNASRFQSIREVLKGLASTHNTAPEAICLSWILKHPSKPIPVLGTVDEKRLISMAQGAEINLSREEWFHLYQTAMGSEIP